jgi:hypothetical protein
MAEMSDEQKKEAMEKYGKIEEAAYEMWGQCQRGDVTYCQKPSDCKGEIKCFEVASDYFMEEDDDACNNFKGGCFCKRFDAEKEKKEEEMMPRPPGFEDDEWKLVQ